jgi:1-acyl-sn-glycerol-3-phosphate acyltransferase
MKRVLESARSTLVWAIALPVLGISCLLIIGLSLVHRGRGLDGLMKAGSRLVLACCGVRVRIRGVENIASGVQYIVMMNHVNIFDPLVLYSRFPGLARGIEEESHFRWPIYGWMLRRVGMIPISRKDPSKARESLARAADMVRERPHYSIVILPEGTRTLDGNVGPFKRGGFHLAVETGLDILPVVQTGAYRINHKGRLLVRPGTVDLTVLPPLSVSGYDRDAVGELADHTRSVFLAAAGAPGPITPRPPSL